MGRQRASIQLKGTLPKDFAKIIKKKTIVMEVACGELGLDVTQFMRDTINSNVTRKPHTGNLANSITLDAKIGSKYSKFCVGDMKILQIKAPYWRVVNDGGYIPPPVVGLFSGGNKPIAGAGGERFMQGSTGALLRPNKPIEPMNYIEHTQTWLNRNFKSYIKAKI